MNLLWIRIRTLHKLGFGNLLRIFIYRSSIKLQLKSLHQSKGVYEQGPFFTPCYLNPISSVKIDSQAWQHSTNLFSSFSTSFNNIPDWLTNPITGKRILNSHRPWSKILDFDSEVGDIKVLWELSRMDWVLAFACQIRQGDSVKLEALNLWLADWCKNNPPYLGPNWKCGQEASIRVMNLAMGVMVLGQKANETTSTLRCLISLHLQRIERTLGYAIAQDNNHGTSEAAALFIGGSWLFEFGCDKASSWQHTGQYLLENRIKKLIGSQGTFSQYSLNYQRMMLDTVCMVELWRLKMQLPSFSETYYDQVIKATSWLYHMIDAASGNGPNVGANDGARLFQFTSAAYRDYRPTVQLAMILFCKKLAYDEGPWNDAVRFLGVELPTQKIEPAGDYLADDGGFAVIRNHDAMIMMRYPRFKFRPSQSDALHVDLWIRGSNILRDAGTYSYNTKPYWLDYFGGTKGHNTIQFDDRDQMPRISRFLFGEWLQTSTLAGINLAGNNKSFRASYRDYKGASHTREIILMPTCLMVKDSVSGFSYKAVLRWRLLPGEWLINVNNDIVSLVGPDKIKIRLICSLPLSRVELKDGLESLFYLRKTALPVLEVEVNQPCLFDTEISWAS